MRIPVTPTTVGTYLAAKMNARNYYLFYGLSLLDGSGYQTIFDSLLNGECEPEELVRLGAFTPTEVSSFLADVLGNWTRAGIAAPQVGTNGYTYLVETLGLLSALQAITIGASTIQGPDPGEFLAVRVHAGAPGTSYASMAAVNAAFEAEVLPGALAGAPLASLFPTGPSDVVTYIAPSLSGEALALTQEWVASLYAPFAGVTAATLGTALLATDDAPDPPLLCNPGLAQWVLAEPESPPFARVLLLREAAVRTAQGPYTATSASTLLTTLETSPVGPVATSRVMAALWLFPAAMAAAVPSPVPAGAWTDVAGRAAAIAAAYAAVSAHRLQLRGFLKSVYEGALTSIAGDYPAV